MPLGTTCGQLPAWPDYFPAAPSRQAPWSDAVKLPLQGQDQFFGANGQPWGNEDQPQPHRFAHRPVPVTNRTHTDNYKLELIGQDTFFNGPGFAATNDDQPNPHISRPRPENNVNRIHLDPLKLNLRGQDILFRGAGGPLQNYDQPLPHLARQRPDNHLHRGFLVPLDLETYQQDTFFGGAAESWINTDQPGPALFRGKFPPPAAIANLTHTDPLKLDLYGHDLFFGAQGEPPTSYWNPYSFIYRRGPITDLTVTPPSHVLYVLSGSDILPPQRQGDLDTSAGLFARFRPSTAGAPFVFVPISLHRTAPPANYDQPNPILRPRPGFDLIEPFSLCLLQNDDFFGANGQVVEVTDWPLIRLRIGELSFYGQVISPGLVIGVKPPFRAEWPLPIVSPERWLQRSQTQAVNLNLIGQDQFFEGPGQPPQFFFFPSGSRF